MKTAMKNDDNIRKARLAWVAATLLGALVMPLGMLALGIRQGAVDAMNDHFANRRWPDKCDNCGGENGNHTASCPRGK